MKKEKWFKPTKEDTGWEKDLPMDERRRKMLSAHHGDELAAGKAMMALANVTTDRETRQKAHADALYFYRQHHNVMKARGGPHISQRVGRLPR